MEIFDQEKSNPKMNIEELKAFAATEDPEAQFQLGKYYYNGEGVEQDKVEAVKWIRKAADQELSDAQYSLGICYFYGDGVRKDHEESIKCFRKAAELGDEDAIEILKEISKSF